MTPKRKCTETVVCRSRPKSNGYHYINVKVGISYWQKKYKKSYQHKNTKPSGCFFVYLDIKKRVSILFGILNIIGEGRNYLVKKYNQTAGFDSHTQLQREKRKWKPSKNDEKAGAFV
jgi:hypothetical protein